MNDTKETAVTTTAKQASDADLKVVVFTEQFDPVPYNAADGWHVTDDGCLYIVSNDATVATYASWLRVELRR